MSYLLIVVTLISGVHDSYIRVTPDAAACQAQAESVRQRMEKIKSEWKLRTHCIPVFDTQGV